MTSELEEEKMTSELEEEKMTSELKGSHRNKGPGGPGALTRRTILVRGSGLALSMTGVGGFLQACGGDSGGGGGSGPEGKNVPYVSFGQQFEFQVALVDTIEKAAKEVGLELDVTDGKADPNLQTTQIQNALAQQPDAILIDPVDPKLIIGGVQQANQADVPVFILENAPPEGDFEAFIKYDDERAGAMGADELARLVGEKGTVLETRGAVGSTQAQLRFKGFNDQMAEYPDIDVDSLNTEWIADKAFTRTLDAFTANPDIAGVWSHNDEMLRGVVSALQKVDRLEPVGEPGHVPLVGLDATPLALDRMREGVQDASVSQDPFTMGDRTVEVVAAFFSDESFEKEVSVEPFLVTRKDADDESLWGNQFA